jgi:cytoskeletal protein RodZ
MTIDFSSTPDDSPTNTESGGSMFAPTPAWERSKKRRMFGSRARSADATRVAEEPRSFAAEPETETLAGDQRAYAFDPIGPTDQSAFAAAGEPAFATTPSYASVTERRKTSVAPVAIAAGIVLLGGLAATGWYMAQDHTGGIAQLTPGSTATTTTTAVTGDQMQTAQNATPQAALPAASASASAPNAAAPAPVTHTTTTTSTHSSAPASVTHRTTAVAHAKAPASRSAADAGTNASATLPATPQPYQGGSSAAAPTPPAATPAPPLVLNIPPATTTQAAPVQTAPAPTVTAPPPTTATPPTPPPSQ